MTLTRAPMRRKVRDTGPTRKTRTLVWERDGGCCVACGRVLALGSWWSMQHRLARGQGGGNGPENLLLLCGSATSAGCHRFCEDRDRGMNAKGYWLWSWQDPAAEPVHGQGGGAAVWLTRDGAYATEAPTGDEAA